MFSANICINDYGIISIIIFYEDIIMAKIESPLHHLPSLDEGLELLRTPDPPYYAIITTNIQSGKSQEEYDQTMQEMLKVVKKLPGFLGSETAYDQVADGRRFKLGVTYWSNLEAISSWREHAQHMRVKKRGKELWYDEHNTRICHVISQYGSNLTQKKSNKLAYKKPT